MGAGTGSTHFFHLKRKAQATQGGVGSAQVPPVVMLPVVDAPDLCTAPANPITVGRRSQRATTRSKQRFSLDFFREVL